jgi:Fe-S cluster assembly ATPase SufC
MILLIWQGFVKNRCATALFQILAVGRIVCSGDTPLELRPEEKGYGALIGKAAQKPCAKAHPSTASLRR